MECALCLWCWVNIVDLFLENRNIFLKSNSCNRQESVYAIYKNVRSFGFPIRFLFAFVYWVHMFRLETTKNSPILNLIIKPKIRLNQVINNLHNGMQMTFPRIHLLHTDSRKGSTTFSFWTKWLQFYNLVSRIFKYFATWMNRYKSKEQQFFADSLKPTGMLCVKS